MECMAVRSTLAIIVTTPIWVGLAATVVIAAVREYLAGAMAKVLAAMVVVVDTPPRAVAPHKKGMVKVVVSSAGALAAEEDSLRRIQARVTASST